MSEPVARGAIVVAGKGSPHADALAKEAASILRALRAPADAEPREADYLVLLVAEDTDLRALDLPDLKDRAATALGLASGESDAEARAVVAAARKQLRAQGASLGARELVFRPSDFGYLGLESDGRCERLEVLLQALALDAERLRLKREGWEEP
ncbi:MAG: hypothetical protein QOE90_61 [Thermoplasmata archaeon]|jgi:hypothetical protein|nr:hypothetical protein [Thermoplasmata archaeon]